MTDQEIIDIVTARKNGETIQCKLKGPLGGYGWGHWFGEWDFQHYDYRVKNEPKELWLQPCGQSLWQEKFVGIGTHFREVVE